MRERSIILASALVAAGALALVLTHIFDRRTTATAAIAPPTVPVVAEVVRSHDVPIYLRGVGTVIAYNNVVVRSQITGEITQIGFTQGQKVNKGDRLAQIDPGPYQAQLDQATANRDRDQAQ